MGPAREAVPPTFFMLKLPQPPRGLLQEASNRATVVVKAGSGWAPARATARGLGRNRGRTLPTAAAREERASQGQEEARLGFCPGRLGPCLVLRGHLQSRRRGVWRACGGACVAGRAGTAG